MTFRIEQAISISRREDSGYLLSSMHLIGQLPNLGQVSNYTLECLRWFPLHQRVLSRPVGSPLCYWRCQLGLTPTYLLDLYRLRWRLKVVAPFALRGWGGRGSGEGGRYTRLSVPFARTTIMQCCIFSVVALVCLRLLPIQSDP